MNILINDLQKLTNTLAVSGYEWDLGIADTIQRLIGYPGVRIEDNLVYTFGKNAPKILFIAHMDEVGFIISKFVKEGMKVIPIGDINLVDIIGSQLVFNINKTLLETDKIPDVSSFSELTITGITKPIIGSVGTFKKSFKINKGIISSSSLDNKVGCLALIETIRNIQNSPFRDKVAFCFSSREETGSKGITSVIRTLNPKLCIDIDSAYSLPMDLQSKENWQIPTLGKGPAIQLLGDGFVIRSTNRKKLEDSCNTINIPFQYEIPDLTEGGTNASAIMDQGYDVCQLNIPVSSQHTSMGKASLMDIENTIKVLTNIVTTF